MAKYISVEDFAAEFDVDDMVIRRLITKGKIIALNMGTDKRKKLRIPVTEFARVEQELSVNAKKGIPL